MFRSDAPNDCFRCWKHSFRRLHAIKPNIPSRMVWAMAWNTKDLCLPKLTPNPIGFYKKVPKPTHDIGTHINAIRCYVPKIGALCHGGYVP